MTSRCGRARSPASHPGRPPGDPAARDGTWRGVGVSTLTVRAPGGWHPEGGQDQNGLCHDGDDGFGCLLVEGTAATRVGLEFERPTGPLPLRPGGPVVGLGVTLRGGYRMRLGYEAGLGERYIGALTTDVSTRGDLVFGAVAGPAFRSPRAWWTRPPAGLVPALGVAVEALPAWRAGVRGQVTLGCFGGALEVSADWWPADGVVDLSLFVRGGL